MKNPNVFRILDATINLEHVLAISTGEASDSPGVDITMRGDRQHFAYHQTQSEADAFFDRIVRQWQTARKGVVVYRQIAFLREAAFSIQISKKHLAILFHHSQHTIRVESGRSRAVYDGLVEAWANASVST